MGGGGLRSLKRRGLFFVLFNGFGEPSHAGLAVHSSKRYGQRERGERDADLRSFVCSL